MLPPGTCLDSEAIIKELMSPITTSRLIKRFKDILNQMGLRNQVKLAWVSGHSSVEGNETPDELARLSSASLSDVPEPFIPIAQVLLANALMK